MKNPHAQALGSLGGKRRKRNLTKAQLHEIAMKGVEARRAKKLATSQHSLRWFIHRIGKAIYRRDTAGHSLTIKDANHAEYLEMIQNDLGLEYSDAPIN